MQIYQALHEDHEEVMELLDDLIDLPGTDDDDDMSYERRFLIHKIRDALIPHSRAEERVLYNSLRDAGEKKTIRHSYREHLEAESLLRALQVKDKISLNWRDTAVKLRSALQHHIENEEENVWALAKQVFTPYEAEVMAEEFSRLKDKIRDESFVGTTWDMVSNVLS